MKARSVLAISAAFLTYWTSVAYSAGPLKLIKVAVTCSGDDLPGQRVCFDLKEKIRTSAGFELVSVKEAEQSSRGFGVNLVSIKRVFRFPECHVCDGRGVHAANAQPAVGPLS